VLYIEEIMSNSTCTLSIHQVFIKKKKKKIAFKITIDQIVILKATSFFSRHLMNTTLNVHVELLPKPLHLNWYY